MFCSIALLVSSEEACKSFESVKSKHNFISTFFEIFFSRQKVISNMSGYPPYNPDAPYAQPSSGFVQPGSNPYPQSGFAGGSPYPAPGPYPGAPGPYNTGAPGPYPGAPGVVFTSLHFRHNLLTLLARMLVGLSREHLLKGKAQYS